MEKVEKPLATAPIQYDEVDVARMCKETRISPETVLFAFSDDNLISADFEKWLGAYNSIPNGEGKEALAKKIIAVAKTFEEWARVHTCIPLENGLAFDKMFAAAKTFEEWGKLHSLIWSYGARPKDSDEAKTVLEKMLALAATYEECETLYANFLPRKDEGIGSELVMLAFEKWLSLAETPEKCLALCNRLSNWSRHESRAGSMEAMLAIRKLATFFRKK